MVRGALKNPQAVVAFGLMVLILGFVSYQKMVVDIFPEINIPVVAVATFYKGMGPSEMEGAVTLRLEQLFLQASYVEHIESRTLPGVSLIKVFFHSNYDVNAGVAEITSLAYSALRYLPKGVTPPTIIKFGASSLPIANLTVSSPTLSEKEIRDIAYFSVRPQLGTVPGASVPPTFGGRVRQITISLNKEQMLARKISAREIVAAVNAANLLIPTGNVKIGDFDYNVYSNSLVKLISQLNTIPIKMVGGEPIFLRDTAIAEDSTAVQVNVVRINGRRAVYIPILKQAGANTIAVIDGIKAVLPEMTGIPPDIETKLIFDQSLYIRQAIRSLQQGGLLGGILACVMIFLFLRRLRAMAAIALAIPLSITTAFTLLYFSGQSINIMTLGGLALAVGLLVNNSIVVQENIYRHRELGKSVDEAARDGAEEVLLPMFVITVCILVVFLPIAFFTGMIKFLFVPLALAVAFAMGASYIASMTVVPVVSAFLERGQPTLQPRRRLKDRLGWFGRHYAAILQWGLGHRTVVVAIVVFAFGGTALIVPRLATEFFPRVDAGEFVIHVAAPEGTRLEKTEAIIARIEDLITTHIPPDSLDQVVANIGLPQGWMVLFSPVNGPHQGFVLVSLTRGHPMSTWEAMDRVRTAIHENLPGLKIAFQAGGVVSDIINFGLPAPIDIKVSGRDLETLHATALDIQERAQRVPGTVDVRVQQGMAYPELHLQVDRTRAAYQGLSQEDIVTEVITGLSSNISLNPGYWIDPTSNNAYVVVAQYPTRQLTTFDDILDTPILGYKQPTPPAALIGAGREHGSTVVLHGTPFSGMPLLPNDAQVHAGMKDSSQVILLSDLVSMERKVGPELISHYNLQRTFDVTANVHGENLGGVAQAVERSLKDLPLPDGVAISFWGELNSMREAMYGFMITMPLTIILLYLTMVALFRSFLSPLIIVFSVPLGFIGVVWMLFLTNTSINVESLIGTLMMIGIVVSTSTLMVEFTNRLVRGGMPVVDAVMQAGAVQIRPVLMTALAIILGLSPMAIGFGEGSETNAPLARAVIGGLSISTLATLFVVPILYSILGGRDLKQRRVDEHEWTIHDDDRRR